MPGSLPKKQRQVEKLIFKYLEIFGAFNLGTNKEANVTAVYMGADLLAPNTTLWTPFPPHRVLWAPCRVSAECAGCAPLTAKPL